MAETLKDRPDYRELFRRYLLPRWKWVSGLSALMLGGMGLQLVNPQILRYFIDGARGGLSLRRLIWAAVGFMAVAVAQQLLSVATSYVGGNIAWSATNEMRGALADHCLRLDMSFHKSRTPGEMIQRIDGDVEVLGSFFSSFLVQAAGNVLLLIGVLAMLLREDWRLGASGAVFSAVMLVAITLLRRVSVPYWKRFSQSLAEMFGFIEERISGTEDLRANGAPAYVLHRFYLIIQKLYAVAVKSMAIGRIGFMIMQFSFQAGQLLGLGFGAWLCLNHRITLGTVFLIWNYVGLLQGPLMGLAFQIESLQRSNASVERVSELMAIRSRIQDGPKGIPPAGALSVGFDSVQFGYVEEEPVLRDVSFQLEPGRTLGLLGRTGSGKTTLTRLLFRLYDANGGIVRVGERDVRTLRVADLRSRVGMVTQDVQIFRASVRDNLTFFDRSISDERIFEAMERLGLDDWRRSLPKGLATVLDSHSGGLSAGEGQLLAFTRVFLSNPGLVILDEASSRLDPATEQRIERAVTKLLENRTAIIVAHRLATVHRVDEVMILEDGRVREQGLRAQLAADPTSRFFSLLRTGLEEAMA